MGMEAAHSIMLLLRDLCATDACCNDDREWMRALYA